MGSRRRNWPTAAMSPSLAAIQTFGEGGMVLVVLERNLVCAVTRVDVVG